MEIYITKTKNKKQKLKILQELKHSAAFDAEDLHTQRDTVIVHTKRPKSMVI